MIVAFDTETFLIQPGMGAPPLVCFQCSIEGKQEIIHAQDPALPGIVRDFLERDTLHGHNVAFDMCVLAAWNNDLLPLIFRAYTDGRILCTRLNEMLSFIEQGKHGTDFSLAACLKRHTGEELDKTDPWRLRYGTLYKTPIKDWPQEALSYALLDARAQEKLFRAQTRMTDLDNQSRAAFWLRLMECRGIRTDREYVEKYHQEILEQHDQDRRTLIASGLVRRDGTRDTTRAKSRLTQVYSQLGIDVPRTEKNQVSLSEEACIDSLDPLLIAYQRYGAQTTTLARIDRLYRGTELPLQASFVPLVDTGRTSCRMGDVTPGVSPPAWGYQLQNLPR